VIKFLHNISNSTKLAIKALRAHKARTLLTVLGIVIGITTIIMILSTGQGLQNIILSQMGSFGSDTIFIEWKVPNASDTADGAYLGTGFIVDSLKIDEIHEFQNKDLYPDIAAVYGMQMGQSYVVRGGQEIGASVWATDASFIDVDNSKVEFGRFYSTEEDTSLKKVIVLGARVAEKLFGEEDPLGKYVKFDRINWRVVGVMEEKGDMMYMDMDKQVYVPLQTYRRLISGQDYVRMAVAKVAEGENMAYVKEQIVDYLRREHEIENEGEEDFRVTSMDEAMEMIDDIMGGIKLLLGVIAAISLLVGGIGIMNIMLVSVSERTPEIGLRKSVGARNFNIMCQFVCEAVVVTLIGGLLGIFFGVFLTWLLTLGANYAGFEWEFAISGVAIVLGLSVSFLAGFVFGLYPAWKAAGLDPIEALRKE